MFNIYSIYDTVSEQSSFIAMHHTTAEAEREFKLIVGNEQVGPRRFDLDLRLLGSFDPHTLEIVPCDPFVIISALDLKEDA